MGQFDGHFNPWAPGGKMSPQMPWAQPGQEHGWGHGNEAFNPPTQQQRHEDENMQLAVAALTAVAPEMVAEERRGNSDSTSSKDSPTVISQAVESDSGSGNVQEQAMQNETLDSTAMETPAANHQSGGSSSAPKRPRRQWANGPGFFSVEAFLAPFLHPDSSQQLKTAANAGASQLNSKLHQLSGHQRRMSFANASIIGDEHEVVAVIASLTELMGRDTAFRKDIMRFVSGKQHHLSRFAKEKVVKTITENLPQMGGEKDRNIHEASISFEPKKILDIILVPSDWETDRTGLYQNIVDDARKQNGWTLKFIDNANDAASYLWGKSIRNLLIVSHGGGGAGMANFRIGSSSITVAQLGVLNVFNGVTVQNVILFSCMAGNPMQIVTPFTGTLVNFGGDVLIAGVATAFNCNAYGNWGWTYESKGKYKFSLFNDPGNIFWVTSGLPANLPYNPLDNDNRLQWMGAGIWTMSDRSGTIAMIQKALFFKNDGSFDFTGYDWRSNSKVSPVIDYRMNGGPEVGGGSLISGWGAWEGAPDFQRSLQVLRER